MKVKRSFNWKEILGNKAWTASELAEKIGIHIITLRRYLRFAEYAGKLIVRKKGRYKLYVAKEAIESLQSPSCDKKGR